KVTAITSAIEEKGYASKGDIEKHVKAVTEGLEKEILEFKKSGFAGDKPVGFKKSMQKALKDNHERISSPEKIKGNQVIQLKDITYADNFPGFDDWRTEFRNDMITIDRDMFHMRDIIPLGAVSGDTIKYPREGAK